MTLTSRICFHSMLKTTYLKTAMDKFLKLMTKAEQATTRKKAQKVLKKVKKLANAHQDCECPLDLLNDSCD